VTKQYSEVLQVYKRGKITLIQNVKKCPLTQKLIGYSKQYCVPSILDNLKLG
jgi:hypothetical protein